MKQVIVIRKDLNMRKGKMVAQGAHASMKVFFDKMEHIKIMSADDTVYSMVVPKFVTEWISGTFTKICVGVDSEEELFCIYEDAKAKGILCSIIQDAGLTEFDKPTYTAVAIGPDTSDKINQLTGHLKLL